MGEKISKIIRQILLCTILDLGAVSCSKYREFKSIGKWKSLCNNESVGMYTRIGNKIYGGNATGIAINKLTSPLNGVDVESFKVCIGSDYAKDKNHVYYPIRMMCSDADTYGGCFFVEYIVKDVSSENFKYIGNQYGTDGYVLVQYGKKVSWDRFNRK